MQCVRGHCYMTGRKSDAHISTTTGSSLSLSEMQILIPFIHDTPSAFNTSNCAYMSSLLSQSLGNGVSTHRGSEYTLSSMQYQRPVPANCRMERRYMTNIRTPITDKRQTWPTRSCRTTTDHQSDGATVTLT